MSWLLSALLFTATLPLPRVDGWIVGSDGVRYFSILRSLAFDHDFDFTNEYARLRVAGEGVTATGLQSNPFALGSALLWSPFYLAGQAVGFVLRAAGRPLPADGYGALDQAAACYGTLFYGGAAFLLARRLGRRSRVASDGALDLALVSAWWATPVIYYLVAEPSMSHGVTLFTVSLFFFAWLPMPAARDGRGWFVLGLAAGLAALTRWQDAVVLLLPLGELVVRLRERALSPAAGARAAAVLALGFGLVLVPQALMWNAIYGHPLLLPQGNDFFRWDAPQLVATLFSMRHGLVSWHPWFALALVSIPLLARRHRALAVGLAACFVLTWYVNAAATRWWADDAFGGRRFTGLVPMLALALAAGIDAVRTWRGGRSRAAVLVLVALIGWNGLAALQYRLGVVPRDQALTGRQMTIDRVLLPIDLVRRRL